MVKTTKKLSISKGNTKVKAAIFNLPAGITCKACLKCSSYCYAKKAERLYPNVLPSRMNNLELSKDNLFFFDAIDNYIKKYKPAFFRIHESGDFYSEAYFMQWVMIARNNLSTVFYTYTKRTDILTSNSLSRRPSNFILNYSLDGIDAYAYRDERKEIYKHYDNIVRVTTSPMSSNCPCKKGSDIKCMVDCFKCATKGNKEIAILKH